MDSENVAGWAGCAMGLFGLPIAKPAGDDADWAA